MGRENSKDWRNGDSSGKEVKRRGAKLNFSISHFQHSESLGPVNVGLKFGNEAMRSREVGGHGVKGGRIDGGKTVTQVRGQKSSRHQKSYFTLETLVSS